MAIRFETLFAIIPIEDQWFDVRIAREDKCICVYGKNKFDTGSAFVKEGDFKNYDELVVMGCAYEVSRDDTTFDQLIGEGLDDDGKRYLIIDRRETYDGKKFQVWMEGYAATGSREYANFHGVWDGKTFQDACKKMLNEKCWDMSSYDEERNSYWACRFFDNEADARKSFG